MDDHRDACDESIAAHTTAFELAKRIGKRRGVHPVGQRKEVEGLLRATDAGRANANATAQREPISRWNRSRGWREFL